MILVPLILTTVFGWSMTIIMGERINKLEDRLKRIEQKERSIKHRSIGNI